MAYTVFSPNQFAVKSVSVIFKKKSNAMHDDRCLNNYEPIMTNIA